MEKDINSVFSKVGNIVISNNEINRKINDIVAMNQTMLANVEETDDLCDDNTRQASDFKKC